MAHHHSSWNFSEVKLPRNAVGSGARHIPAKLNAAVPELHFGPSPNPASSLLNDPRPEELRQAFLWDGHE